MTAVTALLMAACTPYPIMIGLPVRPSMSETGAPMLLRPAPDPQYGFVPSFLPRPLTQKAKNC